MLPNPTMATFTVSLGARAPRPSTRLGTINGAAMAAMVPRALKPASATNSRRVRSFVFDISPLLPRRFPLALGHRRDEFIQAARRERERFALLGALIGRHQEFHDLQAVVEGQQRLFLAEKHAHEMPIFVLIAVCRGFIRDHRHQPYFRILLLDQVFALFAAYRARKEEFQAAVERVPRHRVL